MAYENKQRHTISGFTLVELAVVITVLGILVTITVFSISNWRERTAQGEVQSDLNAAAAAMQDAANFNGSYPAVLPATFSASPNVNVTLIYSTATTYCIEGTSKAVDGVLYNVSSNSTTPVAGGC